MAPAGAITGSTRKRGCALFHHSRAFVGFQLRSIASWAWLPDDAEGSNLQHHLVVKLNGLPRNQAQTTYVAADCVVFPNRRIRTSKKFRSAVCPKKKAARGWLFFFYRPTCSYRFMFFYRVETSAPGLSGYYWYIVHSDKYTFKAWRWPSNKSQAHHWFITNSAEGQGSCGNVFVRRDPCFLMVKHPLRTLQGWIEKLKVGHWCRKFHPLSLLGFWRLVDIE